MKYLIWFFLIPSFYWIEKFCNKQTDGFRLLNIQSTFQFNPNWETDPPSEDLPSLLNQRFTYLNSGGQCYAFISEDEKIIIKFFKYHRRRLPWVLSHLPLPPKYAALRKKQKIKRTSKLQRDFNSYKLSYNNLREESGLLCVHLNKTKNWKIPLTIIDKLGIAHRLDLDQFEFIVQYKADLAMEYFQKLLREKKVNEGKEAIDSLLSLIIKRCKKGIYDEDPRLHCNIGFIQGRAILLDVGRLRTDPTRASREIYLQDLLSITRHLHQWLLKESPELANHLEERLDAL
jgi:hypothetical protein